MIFGDTGRVANGLHVCGIPWSPVYLLEAEQPVLFEAGFTCMWRVAEQMIRSALMNGEPRILFLTHVHWDHCGAAEYLRRAFQGLHIAASARAAKIVKRANAIALIAELSAGMIPKVAALPGVESSQISDEPFLPFDVDLIVEDGQTIEVGTNTSVQVFETPGHTRDQLSYYVPERKILIATESSGCLDRTGRMIAEFLVDYEAYCASLERLASLPVEVLCQGHHFVITGVDEVKRFFDRSIRDTRIFKARVDELLDAEDGNIDSVVARIKAEQYDTNPHVKQLEQAYLLNVRAQVAHLASRRAVISDQ